MHCDMMRLNKDNYCIILQFKIEKGWGGKMKVLIIEDEYSLVDIIREALESV
jgi:hypothetical protein